MMNCLLCKAPVSGDGDLCSSCGFAVQRMRTLGLAIIPAGMFGGCERCIHVCVCKVLEAAQSVGAVVGACQEWQQGSEDEGNVVAAPDEKKASAGDGDEVEGLKRELLLRCLVECPYGEGGQALAHCVPQGYDQRVSYCGKLRGWSLERTGGS